MATWRPAWVLIFLFSLLLVGTALNLRPLPSTLPPEADDPLKPQVLDRHGTPLLITFQNHWNVHDTVALHDIPSQLQQAFILAEDKRFYQHHGIDWLARAHAIIQNTQARRVVRGASTISEQVVRLLHPRPRTFWSRWLETIEAMQLDQRFSKAAILEFYLNQVPYSRQRRGVVQAARVYFDRDLDTLSLKEILALAVLVRSPSRLDLIRSPTRLEPALQRLAQRLRHANLISRDELQALSIHPLAVLSPARPIPANHFVRHVIRRVSSYPQPVPKTVFTSLDGNLQQYAQAILHRRLLDLQDQNVTAGAILVIDHQTDDILAWVNAGGSQIDTVTAPRQPGSTLKPFLYALALQQGWTAATLINDSPLAQAVGVGLHRYHNYSRSYHGPLRLREALGNSLNIPAVRTIAFVGNTPFLEHLHQLGLQGLVQPADHYGDGLALGNGEVTLLELVQAYAVLGRQGLYRPLHLALDSAEPSPVAHQVYSPEISSLMAHILADPHARQREFGSGNLLRFPVETAVKTGTSTDYRDAWSIGFSHRHTVGVWMGNLTQHPMQGVTGSSGPALVLRAIFAELNRHTPPQSLYFSPHLKAITICRISGQRPTPQCPMMTEWFQPPALPTHMCRIHQANQTARSDPPAIASPIQLLQPTPGLQLAMDPRIPDAREAFPFRLPHKSRPAKTHWFVDGHKVGETAATSRQYLWPLSRGTHTAQAKIWTNGLTAPIHTPVITFVVK